MAPLLYVRLQGDVLLLGLGGQRVFKGQGAKVRRRLAVVVPARGAAPSIQAEGFPACPASVDKMATLRYRRVSSSRRVTERGYSENAKPFRLPLRGA